MNRPLAWYVTRPSPQNGPGHRVMVGLPVWTKDVADWRATQHPGANVHPLVAPEREPAEQDELLEALIEALILARGGFVNLRPESGPMRQQMDKHVVRLDAAINRATKGKTP